MGFVNRRAGPMSVGACFVRQRPTMVRDSCRRSSSCCRLRRFHRCAGVVEGVPCRATAMWRGLPTGATGRRPRLRTVGPQRRGGSDVAGLASAPEGDRGTGLHPPCAVTAAPVNEPKVTSFRLVRAESISGTSQVIQPERKDAGWQGRSVALATRPSASAQARRVPEMPVSATAKSGSAGSSPGCSWHRTCGRRTFAASAHSQAASCQGVVPRRRGAKHRRAAGERGRGRPP